MPKGTERLILETPDGYRLHGVHIPPAGREAAERLLVVGFAGNAWNSADAAAYLHDVYPHAHIVAFHYRGYAPSTGLPSSEALRADAPLVLEQALRRVKPKRTVAVGFSIGSGVAASLADRDGVDGIILVTPFDSLKAVAQGHYPWLPVGMLFSEEMDAAGPLETSDVPVAIVAAEHDTLIPPARTDALRRRVRNLVFDDTIRGAGPSESGGS
jgi:pimeloyl-ACP methyl ester carboxylesterase